tara:strand:- start:2 stop:688 length:687 start_codon:yes stop_codon:yes gene_type:complete
MRCIFIIFCLIYTISVNAQVVISPNGITGGTVNKSTNSYSPDQKNGTQTNKVEINQNSSTQSDSPMNSTKSISTNFPDWCLNLPSSDFALYACGTGLSSNLNMSRTRANLDAKRQLADQIDSQISSRMEDFLQSIGDGENEQIKQQSEIITKNVTVEAQLAGYKQKKTEVQNIGSKFQVYVLLEYPIGNANQILINQIKQDENLSTQDAADEALKELEAEINKKKNEG